MEAKPNAAGDIVKRPWSSRFPDVQVALSHYPASSEDLNDKEVPRICNSTYLEDVGVWRLWEAENQLPPGQFVPVSSGPWQP